MIFPVVDLTNPIPYSDEIHDVLSSLNCIGTTVFFIDSIDDLSVLIEVRDRYHIRDYWIFPQREDTLDVRSLIKLLDDGATKVVLSLEFILKKLRIDDIPAERLVASLTLNSASPELTDASSERVSAYLIIPSTNYNNSSILSIFDSILDQVSVLIKHVQKHPLPSGGRKDVGMILPPSIKPELELIKQLSDLNGRFLVSVDALTLKEPDKTTKINIADAFTCSLTSDRADGLFTTVVVDEQGIALGLVYSSRESVREAIRTKKGVYQSRKRGLWYKGATSGAVQNLKSIDIDCDEDALRFVVEQLGSGFCHFNTNTCFGRYNGLKALEKTLQSRKVSAPPGSYTQKLFQKPDLLRSKIMEEADELCSATSKENIAWEAADLIYFALTKCIANDVTLADIEEQLNKRALKITRRPGNAKTQRDVTKPDGDNNDKNVLLNANNSTDSSDKQVDERASEKIGAEGIIKMQKYDLSEITPEKRSSLLLRPIIKSDEILERVRPIVDDVRKKGDVALLDLTAKYDGIRLQSPVLASPFPPELMSVDDATKSAIDQAFDNILKFHEAQYDRSTLVVSTMPGVTCYRFSRPIKSVGLYVPGGTAVLPSTALMLGIPAMVAGCKEIVLACPPRKDGSVAPEVLYVAHKVGATKVLLAGGAQAVAAMAYGTESVPKVDKICGPGNQYVTAAKMLTQNDSSAMISIDMPAGPSELLVIADESSVPAYVASDLLSQAEHGEDSQVVLVAVSLSLSQLEEIEKEIHKQASCLPRVGIVRQSIPKSFILNVANMSDALKFSNDYAPEHLILHVEDADSWVNEIDNAGSIFLGSYSPESCGDYASGTNHTLPTYGYARMYSGVNTQTFLKHMTAQKLTMDGLDKIGDTVMRLAEIEGLEAHRNAVAIRVKDIRNTN
ncbi:10755_t:CDS:2 [Paraglomus occultum]|uniref:Histidine biosynthesis trifunctional protein n=1 Tax=Paraglomus occultum TaxID=144539 RepID=A0A9N9FLC2_9GLOM|nr:10755_t:CDS:2 [Paraglomus occultum]